MTDIILVDGTSYIFRAFHALPLLTTSRGEHTGAIYGFCSMMKKLFNDYPNIPLVIFFDAGGQNFRHKLYPDYKANRTARPQELTEQLPTIHRIAKLFGAPIIECKNIEADDVIGTVAKKYSEFCHVLISTPDKDFCQIVSDKITLENSQDLKRTSVKEVHEKYGISPDQFIDYLALIGDTSDNIPGVPKVGKVTAQKLLNEFYSIDKIYESIDQLKGKLAQTLIDHKNDAYLSQKLVRMDLQTDWPSEIPQHELPKVPQLDVQQLHEEYSYFEFKGLLPTLKSNHKPLEINFKFIDDLDFLKELLIRLENEQEIVFYIDTAGSDYFNDPIENVVFLHQEKSYIVDLHNENHKYEIFCFFKKNLINSSIKWITYDWKTTGHFFKKNFKTLPVQYDDIAIMAYILNPEAKANLESLVLNFLNQTISPIISTSKKNDETIIDKLKSLALRPYVISKLYDLFFYELSKNEDLKDLYLKVDKPLIFILLEMEHTGIKISLNYLQELENEFQSQTDLLKKSIYELAGEEFNTNSTKQLRAILFDKLGLKTTHKTPKGEFSTDEEALQELAEEHLIASYLLDYRQIEKLKSTYTNSLISLARENSHRVHTYFNQAGTITGRLSSSGPNLQNIPIKTENGRKIRKAFIAEPGYLLLSADYSQIELRLMAEFSQDESLHHSYIENVDVHIKTAAAIFNIPIQDVTQDQRRIAKTINFGLIYGMSSWGLARQLKITRDQAQYFINKFFEQYPGVKNYMETMKNYASKHGEVKTLFGRKIPVEKKKDQPTQSGLRAAINGPLQGTASDLIKKAMIEVNSKIADHNNDIKLLLQVHDELLFEVKADKIAYWSQEIKKLMESALKLQIPLVVNVGQGSDWEGAH